MGSLSRTHTHISQVLQPWVVSFQLCIIFFHSHLTCVLSQFSYHAKDGKNLKYIHTWFWLPSSSITCVQWNKETKTTGRVHRAGVTGQRPDGKTHVQILPETKYPLLKSRAEGCYLLQFRFFSHHPDSWIPEAGTSAVTSEPRVLRNEAWKSRYAPLKLCGSGGKHDCNKPTRTIW